MDRTERILELVRDGKMTVADALLKIRTEPFDDLGYAVVDLHRAVRKGVPEVVYGAGKTAEQISGILASMLAHGQERVIITRLSPEKAAEVLKTHPIAYYEEAKLAVLGGMPEPDGIGTVAVATGGTSDIPVAEEAALTLEALGNRVDRIYDVGVAGLHRLLDKRERLMSASVVVAIAGMEGALASVIGGLVACPVIAVPTSVGYGASLNGLSALLSRLNSCASGVSVVNIDNGFGAGYIANLINHMGK